MAVSKSGRKTLRRLRRAAADRRVVRVKRTIRGADVLTGYVVAVEREWVLLAVFGGASLDGYIAVRTADVRSAKSADKSGFWRRALEVSGEWPPAAPDGLSLADPRSMLETAAVKFPLVTLLVERRDPDACFIGRPVGFKKRTLGLLEVTPAAEWDMNASKWRHADISRIEFGGAYESMLWRLSGPPPPWPPPSAPSTAASAKRRWHRRTWTP